MNRDNSSVNDKVDNHIGKLISDVTARAMVDIRFEYEDNDQWAVLSTFQEDDDSEISLRLHSGSRYFFYHGFYDAKDEFQEEVHALNDDQVATIPAAITKVMLRVLDEEEGLRVPGSLLAR
ncbi:MAG: hypothetical protein EOO09_08745 [Chitinophagaceae bacterium]|nr:MAG: hypothetical protein EOO09_08745 [Chitinophagaceae bacterium]